MGSTTTRIADPNRGAQAQAPQGKQGWVTSATLDSAASSTKCGGAESLRNDFSSSNNSNNSNNSDNNNNNHHQGNNRMSASQGTNSWTARPFGQTDVSSSSQVFGRSSNRAGSNASSMLGGVSSSGQANSVESIWGPGSF